MSRGGGATLGVLALAMINVAAIVSVRNLPVMAEYGWSMLALFALSILVFLVPIAMVAAELGTGWPRDGGVYAWVKEAFGERAGFLAVWCDYAENVAWFPTVLSFMAASLAYAIDPALATDRVFLVVGRRPARPPACRPGSGRGRGLLRVAGRAGDPGCGRPTLSLTAPVRRGPARPGVRDHGRAAATVGA